MGGGGEVPELALARSDRFVAVLIGPLVELPTAATGNANGRARGVHNFGSVKHGRSPGSKRGSLYVLEVIRNPVRNK